MDILAFILMGNIIAHFESKSQLCSDIQLIVNHVCLFGTEQGL